MLLDWNSWALEFFGIKKCLLSLCSVYSFILRVCGHTHAMRMCAGQKRGVQNQFSLPPSRSRGQNQGHRAWRQWPLETAPSCQHSTESQTLICTLLNHKSTDTLHWLQKKCVFSIVLLNIDHYLQVRFFYFKSFLKSYGGTKSWQFIVACWCPNLMCALMCTWTGKIQ